MDKGLVWFFFLLSSRCVVWGFFKMISDGSFLTSVRAKPDAPSNRDLVDCAHTAVLDVAVETQGLSLALVGLV